MEEKTYEIFNPTLSTDVDLGKEIKERVSFCDLKLVVHGHSIDVHKVVLAARSKYFETMLTGNFREAQQDSIDLSRTIGSSKALSCIIDYFYTGKVTVTSDNVEDILSAAHLFLLPELKDFCMEFMFRNLCPDNCLRSLALADMFNMKNLYTLCLDMVTCRFQDYLQYREHILEIPGQFWKELIEAGAFRFMKPHEVRIMFLRWMEYSANIRHMECIDILRCMKEGHLLDSTLSEIINENTKAENIPLEFLHAELAKFPEPASPFRHNVHKAVAGCIKKTKGSISSLDAPSGPCDKHLKVKFQIYFPEMNRWYYRDMEYCVKTGFGTPDIFLGFFNDGAVFNGYRDQLLFCDFQKMEKQWTTYDLPPEFSKGYHLFYNGTIFHLLYDITKHTVNLIVTTLDPSTMTWKEECRDKVITVNRKDVKPSLRAYSTNDALYVLVATHKLLKFVRIMSKGTGYILDVKSSPFYIPSSEHRYQPDAVYINEVDKFLLIQGRDYYASYNKETQCWGNQLIAKPWETPEPDVPSWPIRPITDYYDEEKLDIDLDMIGGVMPTKDSDLALLYMAGQGTRHFWIGAGQCNDAENFKWIEATPPPSWASLNKMSVHAVPVDVLKHFKLYSKLPKEEEEEKFYLINNFTVGEVGEAKSKDLTESISSHSESDEEYGNAYDEDDAGDLLYRAFDWIAQMD